MVCIYISKFLDEKENWISAIWVLALFPRLYFSHMYGSLCSFIGLEIFMQEMRFPILESES